MRVLSSRNWLLSGPEALPDHTSVCILLTMREKIPCDFCPGGPSCLYTLKGTELRGCFSPSLQR